MKKIFSILYSAVVCCMMTTFVAGASNCPDCDRAALGTCANWKPFKNDKLNKEHYFTADAAQARACCELQANTTTKGSPDKQGFYWRSVKPTENCRVGYYSHCLCWTKNDESDIKVAKWKNGKFVCKGEDFKERNKYDDANPPCEVTEIEINWLSGELGTNNYSGGTIKIPKNDYEQYYLSGKSWSEIRDIILKKRGTLKPDDNGSDNGASGSGDADESDSEEAGMSKIKEIKVADDTDKAKRDLEAKAKTARENLQTFFDKVDSGKSVWKTEDGSFNTVRLASDLTAGVVLGTVGGVVSGVLIKKSQVEKGFDALNCTVGGQKIADWGDEFTVGLRR